MLLNRHARKNAPRAGARAYFIGVPEAPPCSFGLSCRLSSSQRSHLSNARIGDYLVTVSDLSEVLFRDLLLPFEVTSVLILVAILGAVALARKEN